MRFRAPLSSAFTPTLPRHGGLSEAYDMAVFLWTCEETGGRLNMAASTIMKWVCGARSAPEGFPRPVKLGRLTRFRSDEIEAWIEGLGRPATEAEPAAAKAQPRRGPGRPRKNAPGQAGGGK